MSDDQNLNDVAPTVDNDTQAVNDSSAVPQEDKLYAGKFKTAEDLEKSYLSLQTEYSRTKSAQPPVETPDTDSLADVRPILDAYAKERGLVSRAELEAEAREQEELKRFIAANPDAPVDKIKTLASTEPFKGKSFAEIAEFLGTPVSKGGSRPVKMGSSDNGVKEEDLSSFWTK